MVRTSGTQMEIDEKVALFTAGAISLGALLTFILGRHVEFENEDPKDVRRPRQTAHVR